MKQWMMKPNRADLKKIAQRYHISEILAEILVKRGLYDWESMDAYLFPSLDQLHPAREMKDMELAVSILQKSIAAQESIRIIGDYDVDGVMSTTILYKGLLAAGGRVSWRIPHRVRDGYGLRPGMIEEAEEQGVQVVLTCDNGISAMEAAERAIELGLTLIITDHHEVPVDNQTGEEQIPPAAAIVDPKQSDSNYPFREMCGAGVAYRLVESLLKDDFTKELREELLSLAAIATVCDVVPLCSENRTIVKLGLEYIKETKNIGLSALIRQLELRNGITSETLGFRIGPCINAAGRLQDASLGVQLLTESDSEQAEAEAAELISLNERRKRMTEDAVEQAIALIDGEYDRNRKVLVVYVPDCPESVAGIVAGRIRERYYRPAMILTDSGDKLKGSGRSIPGYHMQAELNRCKELLIEYGGHAMAAGFSLKKENLVQLNEELNRNCTLEDKDFIEKITLDLEVPLGRIDGNLVRELAWLEPVGQKNPTALFARRKLLVRSVRLCGQENKVGIVQVVDEGRRFSMVDFNVNQCLKRGILEKYSEDSWQSLVEGQGEGCLMDMLYRPSINERYQELQYVIEDCR